MSAVERRSVGDGAGHVGFGQICTFEARVAKIGDRQVRFFEDSVLQVRIGQIGRPFSSGRLTVQVQNVGRSQIDLSHVRFRQVGVR